MGVILTTVIVLALAKTFKEEIVDLVRLIIHGVVTLLSYVVDYFKGLKLRKGRDIPFIADETKLNIAERIHNAPVKNVHIFEATYNEDTEEIENYRSIAADEMDSQLKDVLGNEPLVVLN